MIIRLATVFICFLYLTGQAQVLRDLNYNYRYNPDEAFSLTWKVLKQAENYVAFYEFQLTDTTQKKDITLQWETRKSINEKSGTTVSVTPEIIKSNGGKIIGRLVFNAPIDHQIIVSRITVMNQKKEQDYFFYKKLPPEKTLYLTTDQQVMLNSFIRVNTPTSFSGFDAGKAVQITYYNDTFPAAAPAFSTTQGKVSKTIKPDSVFAIDESSVITFSKKGLYLAQHDTASSEGAAFRVEVDYPKLGKLESLVGPLIYICTRQEFDKLKLAGNDKKKFDQMILSITGNTERARTFMRNYFKRVEQANVFFSSYKEGWKTDRGMIYIIYGIPEEVYLFDDREVWEYRSEKSKLRFQFTKSPTLFDPENYVLIRDKKFTDTWYEMIDLWRKARF